MSDQEKNQNSVSSILREAISPLGHVPLLGRLVPRSRKAPGAAPGTVVHTGRRRVEKVRIQAMRFGPDGLEEERWEALPEPLPIPPPGEGVLWINVEGLHDTAVLQSVAEALDVHPLAIEDVASVGQRPKVEDYEDHLFIVLHMLGIQEDPFHIVDEQVSLVMGPGYLVSFQEAPGDVFEPVRERLRSGKGQIRNRGSDYLAYALIDALVDSYFQILEKVGEHMDHLEVEVMESVAEETMQKTHHMKRELLVLRRSVWPLREMVASLLRVEGELIADSTRIYLRDIHDHTYQLIDTVEILRDITAGLKDLYLSSVSKRTNEVMKVLTIMASIFIPLTFVAGVYGMNFEFMPELEVWWAYPGVLLLMLGIALGLLAFFRHRGWI